MSDVYLVDDHAMLRDGLRAVLASAGHRVLGESSDPTQALADILRLAPQVVLLDLNLEPHSGFTLLTAAQRRKLGAKIIVVTMSAQPRQVAEALQLGASGYVLKGAPASELLRALDEVLQGRVFLGAGVASLAARSPGKRGDEDAAASLSARESQIASLVVRGRSSAEIGALLHLSPKTVDSYRSRLMGKLGVGDIPALVRFAVRTGLVDAQEP